MKTITLTDREKWLRILFLSSGLIATAVYLIFELRLNVDLIEFIAIATPDPDEAEALEIEGRRLAAIGAALLVTNVYIGLCITPMVRCLRKRDSSRLLMIVALGAILSAGAWHAMYQLQIKLVDTVVEHADEHDMRNAALLQLLRIGILNGVIHDPILPYDGGVVGKLNVAQLYFFLEMDPATIEAIAGTADEAIYRIVSCRNYREAFSDFQDAYFDAVRSYNLYREASSQFAAARREVSENILSMHQALLSRIKEVTRTDDRQLQIQRFNSSRGRSLAEREFPDAKFLPRPWDLSALTMAQALRPVYDGRIENEFNTELSSALQCRADIAPGLELEEFWYSDGFQRCLKRKIDFPGAVPLARDREMFWNLVWIPWNDASVEDVSARYGEFSTSAFAERTGKQFIRDNGISAVKLTVFVPLAIAFSCLFAYLNFIKLLQSAASGFVSKLTGLRPSAASILSAISVSVLVIVSVYLFTPKPNDKGFDLYSSHIAQSTPVSDWQYDLFLRMQIGLYNIAFNFYSSKNSLRPIAPNRCKPEPGSGYEF